MVYEFKVTTKAAKARVVEKEDDLLTNKELIENKTAVDAAILEELTTWVKFENFRRGKLRDSINVMDSRYVAKWKWVKDKQGKPKRIIRMRLTLRGFKDIFKHEIEKYAGTATRVTQKLLTSE